MDADHEDHHHEHHWAPSAQETRSVIATGVVAVVVLEMVALTVNEWLGEDLLPSTMSKVQAVTPRSVARTATPAWLRYGGWVAAGAVFTVASKVARSALPHRTRH